MLLCWGLRRGLDRGEERECLSDPLDFLDSPPSPALATNTETGIPAVTQHWTNKGRHSSDIEKYSRGISRDESDPLCLSSAWYAGEKADKVRWKRKECTEDLEFLFPDLEEANFCFKGKTRIRVSASDSRCALAMLERTDNGSW